MMTESHPSRELLRRFGSGELHGAETDAIQGHVAQCAVCSEVLRDQTRAPQGGTDPSASSVKEGTIRIPAAAPTTRQDLGHNLPERVGRYRLEQEIARGGMGQVVRVTDEAFQRPLAMKIALDPIFSTPDSSQESQERFVREALITGQLQHPGIPPVQEMGQLADGRPYFIMKLIKGSDLRTMLRERRDVGDDLPRFVAIFEQICQTLGYAHSHGIIHRDLKPANVMVGAFGEVQVMDWGLAKSTKPDNSKPVGQPFQTDVNQPIRPAPRVGTRPPDRPAEKQEQPSTLISGITPRTLPQETVPGTVLGTSAYMAPEQARGEVDTLDARCDVFGLGGILCEILTGLPPFAEKISLDNIFQAMEGNVSGAFARLNACGADAELVDLAKRCLAPNRADRPAHGGVVAKAVARYQEALQERMKQAEIARAAAQVKVREERKRRLVSLALAAVVVLLIAGGGAGALWYQGEMARQEEDRIVQEADKRQQDTERAAEKSRLEAKVNAEKRLRESELAAEKSRQEAEKLQQETERAAEKRLQESELTLRRKFLNREVAASLDAADKSRKDLLERLTNQRSLNALLSDIDPWRRTLNDAQVAWKQASTLEAGSPELIDKALAERLRQLKQDLDADENDWKFGKASDDARLAAVTSVEGKWDPQAAAKRYPRIFAEADLDILQGEPGKIAAQIKSSPIRLVHLAALDNWANFAANEPELHSRLSTIANEVDTDPWRKEFRKANREDRAKLQALADKVDLQGQSPQILMALGMLLELRSPKSGAGAGAGVRLLRKAVDQHPRDFWLFLVLGDLSKDPVEKVGHCRTALAIRPESSPAHNNLGNALYVTKDVEGAIYHYREALRINPNLAQAHGALGNVQRDRKDMKGAIKHYLDALKINPDDPMTLGNLGYAHYVSGDLEGAIKYYLRSIDIKEDDAIAHFNLAVALRIKKDVDGAVKHYRRVLEIDPNNLEAHGNLGNILREQRDVEGALELYRKAIAIKPDDARAHLNLGAALLYDTKDLDGAIKHFLRALEINPNYATARNNLVVALDKRLLAVLQGGDLPADPAVLLALADLCQNRKHFYAASTRFYAAVLEKQPGLANDLVKSVRYNAACAAALAGTGKGKDADKLLEQDKVKLRRQALDWLREDLAQWRKLGRNGNAQDVAMLSKMLSHWQRDSDFAGVRDGNELAGLPKEERETWQQLWADVAQLLKEPRTN